MLFILVSIILFTMVLGGWGMLLMRLVRREDRPGNPWLWFFLGYSILAVVISYISFFRRLDTLVLVLAMAIGLVSFVALAKKTKTIQFDFSPKWRILLSLVLIFLLFNIAVSLGGKGFPKSGDTTGYHMGIVSWLNNFPLVPGLANLHFRLGSYSSYLQLSAVMDNYIWNNNSPFVMPGLFFFAFCAYFIWEVIFAFAEKNRKNHLAVWRIFYAAPLLLASVVYYFNTYNSAPNLYYDILPMFLAAIIVNEIIKYFIGDKSGKEHSLLTFLFTINLLAMAAYLSKQNAAMIVLLVALLSFYLLFKNKLINLKNLGCIFFLPACGFLGSIVANLITSGYPFFPLPFMHVNFPWTASKSSILGAYNSIRYWAKLPGKDYMSVAHHDFWYWFLPWAKRNMSSKLFFDLVFISFVSGSVIWVTNIFLYFKKQKRYHWLFLALLLNLAYWFFSAPDIRFGLLFFVIFFAAGLAVLALFLADRYATITSKVMHKYAFVMAVLLLGIISIKSFAIVKPDERIKKKTKNYFYVTFTDSNQFYEKEMETKDGKAIVVYKPKKDNECRSLPLPCTPYYSPSVKAFNSENLGAGFYYDKAN